MASNIFKELEKGSYTGLKRSLSLFPVSVNLKNLAGLTPLHIAAQQGQAAFVKELLVHGAQHDTTDSRGNIPLHLAAEQGSVEAVAELLAGRKASAKAKNKDGQTPLHVAVLGGHKVVVAKLLETGIHAEGLKDKAGNTPLSLVDPDDKEMQQVFADTRSIGPTASTNQGVSSLHGARGPEATPGGHRAASASGGGTPISSHSGRITAPQLQSFASGGAPAGTPVTPPPRGAAAGSSGGGGRTPPPAAGNAPGGGGRTPPPAPAHSQSGALTSRLPRSATASPGQSGGGAAPEQLQKHEMAIQSLKEGLRAATERLGALDACTAAQLECAGQVEKALEACGNHGRSILDLEARVVFQEDRGRDTRSRLERVEEGERDRQDAVKRLADDQRSLQSQLQRMAEQVTASGSAQRHTSSADAASYLQGQAQLQAELAVLRAQMDQLAPALALATAASADVRTLAARVDVMQQQMQQQQMQQQPAAQALMGGNLVVEQQLLQMQAQIQLLQLPVANLTQQCADMSGRIAGFTEWQQQARADLAKLAEAATAVTAQLEEESKARDLMSGRFNEVMGVASQSLEGITSRMDVLWPDYEERLKEKQQQAAVPASPSPPPGPPAVPGTPQSASQRISGAGDPGLGPFGGPPSRNLTGPPSLGGMARESMAQVELRSELESLKSLVSDIRKEVATEGGSLRREWQRAFSDMQSRYGEQTNELRAREANIAKLREAALVEEAERRAASGFEDKFAARLGKVETSVEYLTHRLEVLEEQVSSVVTTLAGATSPMLPPSPSRIAAAWAALRGQPSSRSGPGPVSENHIGFVAATSELAAAAAAVAAATAMPASARIRASPKTGRSWSTGGPVLTVTPGEATVQSDGGCLRRRNPLFSVKDPVPACAGGGGGDVGVASAREACSARDASEYDLGPEEWWRAAEAEPPELLEDAIAPAALPAAGQPPSVQGTGGGGGPSLPLPPDTAEAGAKAAAAEAVSTRQGAASSPQPPAMWPASATDDAADVVAVAQRPPGEAAAVGRGPAHAGQPGPEDVSPRPREVALSRPEPITPASSLPTPPTAREALLSARGRALPPMHAAQPGTGAGLLDPASVSSGPQLLTPMANALLAPSVDIQRLAAAAAAAQQQQLLLLQHQQQYLYPLQQQPFLTEQQQMQQQQQPALQLWGGQQQQPLAGSLPRGVGFRSADGTGGIPEVGRPAAASADGRGERQASGSGAGGGPARKEPPLCLFCPMQ